MADTLRSPIPRLWLSDAESAGIVRPVVALVVDCTGDAPEGANVIHVTPSGRTNHSWSNADLDRIVAAVAKVHQINNPDSTGKVLIHCRRGVSRSVTAAAAYLLHVGRASSVEDALAKTSLPGYAPASQSVAGLKRWWQERQQGRLFR